jgi:hypothetical protein
MVAVAKWPDKDPNEVLDYDIDWAGTEEDPGRTFNDPILSSSWTITSTPDDGFLVMGANLFSATATKIWLSGGTLGKQYKITNRITTTGGRTMDKSGMVTIREK